MAEQLEAKAHGESFYFPVPLCKEGCERESAARESVSIFHVWMEMSHAKRVDVYSLLLYQSASYRHPCHKQQRSLVCHIGTHVVFRCVVPSAVEQLKRASPFVVPSSRNVLLMEVGIVEEVVALAFMCIESCAGTHLQTTQS